MLRRLSKKISFGTSYPIRFFHPTHRLNKSLDHFAEIKIVNKEDSEYNHLLQKQIKKEYIERDYPLSLRDFQYDHSINITLNDNITMHSLPHSDFYTAELLNEKGLERLNSCMLLMRGDKRNPDVILETGLRPKGERSQDNIFNHHPGENVHFHQSGGVENSGLVSFTSKMASARNFIGHTPGYLYTVKATGAICNINHDAALYRQEFEYSVPDGVGPEDIVAFRRHFVKNTSDDKALPNYSGPPDRTSVYLCKEFMCNFPQHVLAVIKSYLFIGENCKLDKSIPTSIVKLSTVPNL